MVVLREYDVLSDAEMAKTLLDNEGMWCMVNNEYMSTIYPQGIAPTQLITRQEDAQRAMEILQAIENEEALNEEMEEV